MRTRLPAYSGRLTDDYTVAVAPRLPAILALFFAIRLGNACAPSKFRDHSIQTVDLRGLHLQDLLYPHHHPQNHPQSIKTNVLPIELILIINRITLKDLVLGSN